MDDSLEIPTRWNVGVDRSGDTAMIWMDLGGFMRVRHMPCDVLKSVREFCQQMCEAADGAPEIKDVPEFPGYCQVVEGLLPGVCQGKIGYHRLNGCVERVLSLYDEEDESAPVIILIAEQIEGFFKQIA